MRTFVLAKFSESVFYLFLNLELCQFWKSELQDYVVCWTFYGPKILELLISKYWSFELCISLAFQNCVLFSFYDLLTLCSWLIWGLHVLHFKIKKIWTFRFYNLSVSKIQKLLNIAISCMYFVVWKLLSSGCKIFELLDLSLSFELFNFKNGSILLFWTLNLLTLRILQFPNFEAADLVFMIF